MAQSQSRACLTKINASMRVNENDVREAGRQIAMTARLSFPSGAGVA